MVKTCCKYCCRRDCNCASETPQSMPISWNQKRLTAAARGYGNRWRKARLIFLKNNPLCVYCLRLDKVTAGFAVDHIEPHRGDMGLFWDVNNWQTLCESCHNRKTAGGE